jgi:hypothetical protein
VFSPVFVAWGMLDPAPTMRMFDLVVFAHLLAGGLGMAAIGWRARWPIPAGVLAAALFMFGGAASGRLQHSGIILSYGLFPLALLLLQLAFERRSLLLAAAFSAVAADIALGRNQVALLLCGLLLAAAIAELSGARRPIAYLRERIWVLTTMAATCGALLIVPVLLTMQFAQLSNRPAEVLEGALKGSLYPADLANLAVADVFGTHHSYWGPGAATLPEVALTDDSENYLFVGAIPTLLVLWFGLAGGGVWRPGRRLMTATLATACLFMLGRYTPFYGLLFRFVPGIDLFRRPTDASFVFGIALAMLAGHCLSDYVREGLPRIRPIAAILTGSVWLAIMVSAIMFSARTGHALEAARQSLLGSMVMLAAAVLIFFGARRRPVRDLAAALVTLSAVTEFCGGTRHRVSTHKAAATMRCSKRQRAPKPVRSRCSKPISRPIIAAATGRAWRSLAWAGPGKISQWSAGGRPSMDTTRSASACTIAWSRPAKKTGMSRSGDFHRPLTITTARSPRPSA